MESAEIDGDVWTIPALNLNTKVEHKAFLMPDVMDALARRTADNDTPWVFPSPTVEGQSMRRPDSAFYTICKRAGISGLAIHDLRRTLGSRLAAKVPLTVVAKVLGHYTINTTMWSYVVISEQTAREALASLWRSNTPDP